MTSPDRAEKLISAGAVALLLALGVAIWRGQAHWAAVPQPVWAHMLSAATALALTPAILWTRRGTVRHRLLGYLWLAALGIAAATSFAVHQLRPGHFSPIHLLSIWTLSLWTLAMLPLVALTARCGAHTRHRAAVRGLIIGALLIAGAFTFLPSRILGHWLWG